MIFILDPDSPENRYRLRRASLSKIFEVIKFAPLEKKRELEALEYIKNNYKTEKIHAPFIAIVHKDYPMRIEGKHRLNALKVYGCEEIAIGVPHGTDLKKLEFLI